MHPRVEQSLTNTAATFIVRRHSDCSKPIRSPQDFADCLGYKLSRITKTLFCRSVDGNMHALIVAPMDSKVDFSAVATELGMRRVEMASRNELSEMLGYPPHGVSPLGSDFKVLVDSSIMTHDTVLIGGGVTGVEVELSPQTLITLSNGTAIPLTT